MNNQDSGVIAEIGNVPQPHETQSETLKQQQHSGLLQQQANSNQIQAEQIKFELHAYQDEEYISMINSEYDRLTFFPFYKTSTLEQLKEDVTKRFENFFDLLDVRSLESKGRIILDKEQFEKRMNQQIGEIITDAQSGQIYVNVKFK